MTEKTKFPETIGHLKTIIAFGLYCNVVVPEVHEHSNNRLYHKYYFALDAWDKARNPSRE